MKTAVGLQDTTRNVMFVNSSRVRQDPQSHHLVVWDMRRDPKNMKFDGKWTCRGGAADKLVTRASRMPERTSCVPVACVAGKVTAACKADKDCDSSPGAGDGDCDACPIVAGQTTENEMFLLTPWCVLPPKK